LSQLLNAWFLNFPQELALFLIRDVVPQSGLEPTKYVDRAPWFRPNPKLHLF
jgi:hypothetical protein